MSFILLASMRAKEGKTQDLIDAILPIVEASRAERGCVQYQFSQGQKDPREIAIWEEYESDEAFTEHISGEHFVAIAKRWEELIEGGESGLSLKRFNVVDRFH